MANYSFYDSLSAEEFQAFATEFISIKEKEQFYNNGLGKDGGIDLYNADSTIIGQVKNQKDNFANLKNSLKKEVDRVQKFNRYILIVSQTLKQEQKKELIKMFKGHLKIEDIIDKNLLNQLLSKKEYHELELKYYQLYIPSSNILFNTIENIKNNNIYLQTQIELNNINKEKSIYVATESYKQALKKLLDQNIIIITGEPGIGKTTLGRMLIIALIKELKDAEFVKVTSVNELYDIYKEDKSQIYFFDDFWGDVKYNLSISPETQKKLYNFISLLKQTNKYLIITSREYIFQEGLEINNKISREFINHQFLLKQTDLSLITKFNILYNYIIHYPLPYEHAQMLFTAYNNIVNCPNYNPRFINTFFEEYNNYKNYSAYDFYYELISYLNHTYDHFQKDLKNQPLEIKVLLLLIFINEGQMPVDKLQIYFSNIFDKTGDKFKDYITITDNTFTNIVKKEKPIITLKNPTYKDFLSSHLKENINFYFKYLTKNLTKETSIILWEYVNYKDLTMKQTLETIILKYLKRLTPNQKYINILITLVKTTNFNEDSQIKDYLITKTEKILAQIEDIMYETSYEFDLDNILNLLKAFKNKHDFSKAIYNVLDAIVYESEDFYQIDKLSNINDLYPEISKKYIKNHRQDIKKTIENCIYNDINYYDMNLQELENLIYEWVPNLYRNINVKMPAHLIKNLQKIYDDKERQFKINYPKINVTPSNIEPPKSQSNETDIINQKIRIFLGKSHYIENLNEYMQKHHFNQKIINQINTLQGPIFDDLKHNTIIINLLNNLFESGMSEYISENIFFAKFFSFIYQNNLKEFKNLASFAFKTLNQNQITFTKEELDKANVTLNCKIIIKTGKWYYFSHPLLPIYLYIWHTLNNNKNFYIYKIKTYFEKYYDLMNEYTNYNLNEYRLLEVIMPQIWKNDIVTSCIEEYLAKTQKEDETKTAIQMLKYFQFEIVYGMFEEIETSYIKDIILFDLIELYFDTNMLDFIPDLSNIDYKNQEQYNVNYYLSKKSIIKIMQEDKTIESLITLRNELKHFVKENKNILDKNI